jgi:CRP/FNR family transcriptional regulator, anaerobic regulatory protein
MPRQHSGVKVPGAPAGLDAMTESVLAGAGRVIELREGAPIRDQERGAFPSGFLVSGILRYRRLGADGRRQIVNLILPGEVVRAERLQRDGYALEAATRVKVFALKPADFVELLKGSPALERADQQSLQTQLDRLRRLTWSILVLDAETRLVAFLDCLASMTHVETLPRGSFALTLPLSRQDIADLLAMSVSTLNRKLRKLEGMGLLRIHRRQRLEIFDPRGLREWAGQGNPLLDCPERLPSRPALRVV